MKQTIRIKYFTDKIDKLAYIGGKSDWIDLRAAERVELKKGEFSNIKNNPIPQFIKFDNNVSAKFFRFETITGADGGKPSVAIGQIGILTQ